MVNGMDILGRMSDNMKRNMVGHDMKVDLLKNKIKAKKIGKIKHLVSGMGND